MPTTNNRMINFDGQTLFRIIQGGTFTIPDTVSAPSPSGLASSGYAPTTSFDGRRNVAGGLIFCCFTNDTGNAVQEFELHINAADVIAVSAIASNAATVTQNGNLVFTISGSAITVAGVLGFYG